MSKPVIRVENLSKRYRLGEREQYQALRDVLAEGLAAPWRYLWSLSRQTMAANGRVSAPPEYLWALRNVSFEVREGEIIGIIGRNGAGKSTLLKILSRITRPTTGLVKIRGRVGSLLEVGTGFHPELTGRENVYLNGAVLGMKRAEIERKFDEIVSFAEIEKFLDTPVKRFSSGMYMRLAFAVAAHLEAEIMLVDEVLAVGDVEFQKKCLGKMDDVARQGRTVLFVSHNMNAIQRLCPCAMLIEEGQLVATGETLRVITRYLANRPARESPGSWIDVSAVPRRGTGNVQVVALQYGSSNEAASANLHPMGPLQVSLKIFSDSSRSVRSMAVMLYDENGSKLVNADSRSVGQVVNLRAGENMVRLKIKELYLNPGVYTLGWWLADGLGTAYDFVEAGLRIEVVDIEANRLGGRPKYDGMVACHFQLLEVNR